MHALYRSTRRNSKPYYNTLRTSFHRTFSSPHAPTPKTPKPKPTLYTRYTDALSKNPYRVKLITAAGIFTIGDVGTQIAEQTILNDSHTSPEVSTSVHPSATPPPPNPPSLSIDFSRTLELASFGMLATTFIHCWWGILEPFSISLFPPASSKLRHVLFKVLADQGIGGVCYNVIFFVVQGGVRGWRDARGGGEGAEEEHPKEGNEKHEGGKRYETTDRQDIASAVTSNVRYQLSNNLIPQLTNHWCFWPFFHFFNFWYNPLHQRVVWQNIASIGWGAVLSRVGERNRRMEREGKKECNKTKGEKGREGKKT